MISEIFEVAEAIADAFTDDQLAEIRTEGQALEIVRQQMPDDGSTVHNAVACEFYHLIALRTIRL